MLNSHQENLIQKLEDWARDPRFPPSVQNLFNELRSDAQSAKIAYDDVISQLEMQVLRNPSFPSDLMGWLDDDFDDEDDEEDNSNIV